LSDERPYNAGNPKDVAKREKKAKAASEKLDEQFKQLLELPAFRRFLWNHICVRCKLFQSPYNPNGSAQTHNIGRQDVGRELFVEVERIDPKLITLMMSEHAEGGSD
jgi:hypothetical protein